MRKLEGETFVLWIQRAQKGSLVGSVEHIADSRRREFESIEELGELLAQALDDAHHVDGKDKGRS